ncbi:MAG: TIR domain-containing protein [Bacteroidaceae bacterium]|nr:TIR domain-containing protein [Bacteroidaceae bacterium]
MKYDVFISYSSHDQKIVEAMCAYLEQRHIRCFVAYRDIPRGGSKPWAEHIVNALDESRMMLVAFSENFNASVQVNREIEIASEDKKPILTFRLSNAAFTGAKKYYLKNINWLDAFPVPEKAFDDMYKQVCLLLGMQPVANSSGTPPPPPPAPRSWGKLLLPVAALLLCVGIGVSALRGCKNTPEEPQPTVVKDTIVVVDKKAEQERETFAAREREAKKLRESLADATAQLDKAKKEAEESTKQRELPKSNAVTTPTTDSRAVDLGLSVKWASCNVGATAPEEYGDYYAWGETEEKSNYFWSTYKYCNGSYDSMTKYCTSSGYGTVDNKTTLEPCDDVASVKWGGTWRMPTRAEQQELISKCTWTWTTLNGVKGYRVTGPNGNSIFLPAAGYRNGTGVNYRGSGGLYWSSSLGSSSSNDACNLGFISGFYDRNYDSRCGGRSVRPVCP